MGGAAIAAGGLGAAGGIYSAYAQGQEGAAQASYYNYLSGVSAMNAGLAKSRGVAAQQQIGAQENQQQIGLTNTINQAVGAQKTAMTRGVGNSSRSAQDIVGDTLNKGNLDEMALRLNSDLAAKSAAVGSMSSAMNYMSQGAGYNIAGGNARTQANFGIGSSLLGAAGSVANSYYMGNMYGSRNFLYA